jgi:hypothetical protein
VSTIVNRGEWVRGTTVSLSADHMTAYHIREFVRRLDEEGVPDKTEVTDRHANDTRRFVGLTAHVKEVATPTPAPQYTEDDPDWAAMVSPISDTDGGHSDR